MRYPFLEAAGLDPELNLESSVLSNGLILELWSKVEVQRDQKQRISWNKISRREFSHLVGVVLNKWEDDHVVSPEFIRKAAHPNDLETLSRSIGCGLLLRKDLWQTGVRMLARVGKKKRMKISSSRRKNKQERTAEEN